MLDEADDELNEERGVCGGVIGVPEVRLLDEADDEHNEKGEVCGGPGGGGPCGPGGPGGPGGIINPAGLFTPPAKLSLISFNNLITPSS